MDRERLICILSTAVSGPLPNADNFFFVSDKYLKNIYQIDATSGTTGQLLPLGTATNPTALTHDSTAKLLYWTDVDVHTVNRYSLLTRNSIMIYRDPSDNGKLSGVIVRSMVRVGFSGLWLRAEERGEKHKSISLHNYSNSYFDILSSKCQNIQTVTTTLPLFAPL